MSFVSQCVVICQPLQQNLQQHVQQTSTGNTIAQVIKTSSDQGPCQLDTSFCYDCRATQASSCLTAKRDLHKCCFCYHFPLLEKTASAIVSAINDGTTIVGNVTFSDKNDAGNPNVPSSGEIPACLKVFIVNYRRKQLQQMGLQAWVWPPLCRSRLFLIRKEFSLQFTISACPETFSDYLVREILSSVRIFKHRSRLNYLRHYLHLLENNQDTCVPINNWLKWFVNLAMQIVNSFWVPVVITEQRY